MNEADYAAALESGRRAKGAMAKAHSFIKDYVASELENIVQTALDTEGAQKQRGRRRQSGFDRVSRLVTRNLISTGRPYVAVYNQLGRENRRFLRTFRPSFLLDTRADLPFQRARRSR